MVNAELQYISDTILLDKFITVSSGLLITKEAGATDTIKNYIFSIADDIKNEIKKDVQDRVKNEGLFGAFVSYLSYGWTILKGHWLLGALLQVLESFGFSPGTIINSVIESFRPDLEAGRIPSLDKANQVVKANLPVEGNEGFPTEADKPQPADDMLYVLRNADENNNLVRILRQGEFRREAGIGDRVRGWLLGVGPRRSNMLGGGLIAWVIKTILLALSGAAIVGIKHEIGEKITGPSAPSGASFPGTTEETPAKPKEEIPQLSGPAPIAHDMKSTGWGETYHSNTGNTIWVVPLIKNNVKISLFVWSYLIYPDLREKEPIVWNTPAFNIIASNLEQFRDKDSPKFLIVPRGIHTIKEIVDRFVGHVAQRLKTEPKAA